MVSQQALSTFFSRPFEIPTSGPVDNESPVGQPKPSNSSHTNENGLTSDHCEKPEQRPAASITEDISVEEILCPHSKLDPRKAGNMKRIDLVCPILSCVPDRRLKPRRLRTDPSYWRLVLHSFQSSSPETSVVNVLRAFFLVSSLG